MILILGGSGYVGGKMVAQLARRGLAHRSVSRSEFDYTRESECVRLLRESGATYLINAAGYTGKPNVDACETDKANCLEANAVLPGVIARAVKAVEDDGQEVVWGHVASGCIFSGRRPDGAPWREDDEPNFSFRSPPCSWYSGTKALGEEVLADAPRCYQWRLRIPFDQEDSPRNYISKLLTYETLLDAENSISHLDDYANACIDCLLSGAEFGIYNLTNPGSTTARDVIAAVERAGIAPGRTFQWFEDEADFMTRKAKTPRSNCVLDAGKSVAAGFGMRPIEEALQHALENWTSARK